MLNAKSLIAAERQRQIAEKGYSPKRDDAYTRSQLQRAGEYYAAAAAERIHLGWPWAMDTFKPSPNNRCRELVKAGALFVAELARFDRAGITDKFTVNDVRRCLHDVQQELDKELSKLEQDTVDMLAKAPGFSLLQPWASLAAHGYKRMETRSQNSYHRGPTLLHASKGKHAAHRKLCETDPYIKAALAEMGETYDSLPRGVVVGVYTQGKSYQVLNPVYRERDGQNPAYLDAEAALAKQELAMGDYTPGRYTYEMNDARPLSEPVPASGALSFWKVPAEVRTLVAACLIVDKVTKPVPSPAQ